GLALAEDAAGQKDARTATLQRFVSLQERYGGYDPSSLEPDLRSKFQALVLKEIRRDRLMQSPDLAYQFGLSSVKPPPRPTATPAPRIAALPTPPAAAEPQSSAVPSSGQGAPRSQSPPPPPGSGPPPVPIAAGGAHSH